MKKLEDLVKRNDELIAMATAVLQSKHYTGHDHYVDSDSFAGFRSASLSFISRVFGPDHVYYKEFDKRVAGCYPSSTSIGLSILNSIKGEITGGWLFTTKGLVSAEIFADFIEMAEYLLSENYKDAAAVIIGSVLEEHLRQLCLKHDIPTEKEKGDKVVAIKADTLNHELVKADVYNKLVMKQITAWLDLRNKAAHGEYDEYDKKQVELMLQGVRDFISRTSI